MSTSSPASSVSSAILSVSPFDSTSTTRLQALYSDFSRQKHSNPVSFQSNVDWWKKALETVVSTGLQDDAMGPVASTSRLALNANSSLMNLVKIPKVGKPLALGTVLAELHASNTCIPINDFMTSTTSIYAMRSLPVRVVSYVVGKPLWWALEQAGIVGDEGLLGSGSRDRHKGTAWYGDYVFVPLLEKAGDSVVELQERSAASPADALYTYAGFSRTFSGSVGARSGNPLCVEDLKILLKYLERDRKVLVYDKSVIKFVDPHAPTGTHTITAVDKGVLELKSAVDSMGSQVEAIQQKIDKCTREASDALQRGHKLVALNHVRLRKQLQELLTKRLNSMSTLESTLLTVEAAMGDVEIMNSYESSTATLKSILAHPSLQRDNVDKTMEALAEANADAREIDETIRVSGDVAAGAVTDEDVEEEWEALLKEMEGAKVDIAGSNAEEQRQQQALLGTKAPHHIPTQRKDKVPMLAG